MTHVTRNLLLGICLALLSGCDRTPPEPAKPSTAKAGVTAAPSISPEEADTSYKVQAPGRVVAIGDLHGDLAATKRALRVGGLIDDKDAWSGGKTVLVQTGDVLDRGDDERAMLDLFDRLKKEAKAAGGTVYTLNGNHEVMNVSGDFRYVTRGGFTSFEDISTVGTKADLAGFPPNAKARAAAFWPGGPYAVRLAEHETVVMVNDSLFVHGGVLPKHLRYGLAKINREVKAWMRGESEAAPAIVTAEDGPIWTRRYSSSEVGPNDCRMVKIVLERAGAKRMVVGHTVQEGGITSACDDRVWRIDVGLAAHYGSAASSALAIDADKVTVLREKGDAKE